MLIQQVQEKYENFFDKTFDIVVFFPLYEPVAMRRQTYNVQKEEDGRKEEKGRGRDEQPQNS